MRNTTLFDHISTLFNRDLSVLSEERFSKLLKEGRGGTKGPFPILLIDQGYVTE